MDLPQIRIDSRMAKIGMETERSKLEIQQKPADISIQQPKAEMFIERRPSKLTIDQTKAREDMDLKNISKRIEEFAEQGYQDWLDGLARVSQDGDELMKIENGFNAIPDLAKRNSEPPIYDFNIAWIPSPGSVKLSYDPGEVNIQWQTHKPNIDVKINKPMIHYTPDKTRVFMQQQPSLKIDFDNLRYVGINYEQTI